MLLIDLRKAFDTVWHNGLLFKLKMYNLPFYILQTMQSYLSQRTFYVYNENERSLERKINAGVPQGSILGPVLFNLYINNIPSRDNTCLAAYADHTAVLSTSMSVKLAMRNLQQHAVELANWCEK
jgi:retron-type reverse transcriptase